MTSQISSIILMGLIALNMLIEWRGELPEKPHSEIVEAVR